MAKAKPAKASKAVSIGGVLDTIKYARFLPLVVQIVSAIQVLRGPGDGAGKKAAALAIVASAIALTEGISEKDLINDEEGLALASDLVELGVDMMKLQPRVERIAARLRAVKVQPAA